MGTKRPALRGKPQRLELALHLVLEQLDRGIGVHARPDHTRTLYRRKGTEPLERERERPSPAGSAAECRLEIGLGGVRDLAEKLERQMNSFGTHPAHRQ